MLGYGVCLSFICSIVFVSSLLELTIWHPSYVGVEHRPYEMRAVERRSLLEVLAKPLPSDAIKFNSRVKNIKKPQSAQKYTELELEDGTIIKTKVCFILELFCSCQCHIKVCHIHIGSVSSWWHHMWLLITFFLLTLFFWSSYFYFISKNLQPFGGKGHIQVLCVKNYWDPLVFKKNILINMTTALH